MIETWIGTKWILRPLACLRAPWIRNQWKLVDSVLSDDH